jgi:hypothetical protein
LQQTRMEIFTEVTRQMTISIKILSWPPLHFMTLCTAFGRRNREVTLRNKADIFNSN